MIKIINIIFIFLLFGYVRSDAQFIPATGGIMEHQNGSSIVSRSLKDKYDFLISYYVTSGWTFGDTTSFQILALKNKTWKKIIFKYSERNILGIPKIEIVKFNKLKARKLMDKLTELGFWSLNNDSLNIKEIKPKIPTKNFITDNTVVVVADRIRKFSVVDGTTFHFEIIQKNKITTFSCESPDAYLNVFPEIKSTSIFTKAIKAFENAVNN